MEFIHLVGIRGKSVAYNPVGGKKFFGPTVTLKSE